MWKERLVVVAGAGSLVVSLVFLVWRENERRYAAFAMTGCFGDSAISPLEHRPAPADCVAMRHR